MGEVYLTVELIHLIRTFAYPQKIFYYMVVHAGGVMIIIEDALYIQVCTMMPYEFLWSWCSLCSVILELAMHRGQVHE